MSYVNIPLSDLESKKKLLQNKLAEINEELGHIEWVIKNYKKDENLNSTLDLLEQTSISHGHGLLTVQKLIETILEENKPRALSTDEILRQMALKGREIKKANLFAHLSRYTKLPNSKIQRVALSQYSAK